MFSPPAVFNLYIGMHDPRCACAGKHIVCMGWVLSVDPGIRWGAWDAPPSDKEAWLLFQ